MSEEEPAELTVRLKRPATRGAVGRLDDGRVVFVRHALPGELVRLKITDRSRNFARADAVEILEASPERVAAPCPYAHPGGCGGCDLQHATGAAQLAWKASVVSEHLRRIAGVERDVIVEDVGVDARGSRTRLRCAVDGGRLALRAARSHDLVAVDACWIADERLRPAFASAWPIAHEVELRAIGEGEPFAVVRRDSPHGVIAETRDLDGQPVPSTVRSRVTVAGVDFLISPLSFWQSHRAAPKTLVDAVASLAAPRAGDTVVDLFSGVGLFAIPLARSVGPSGHVTAVESSPESAEDARDNARALTNLTVREWSVSARSVNDTVGPDDLVVMDPPRHGLSHGVAPALIRRRPRRMIYVSCDAATFSRDLKIFLSGGYTLSDLRVFDLFPMTEHVELVALLDTVQ